MPQARAWTLTADKQLRQFFDGLTGIGDDLKDFVDDSYLDIFPETTREIDSWESQFDLRDTGLTEQERRDRLDATWKEEGGQSPRYLQDTLQAAGFDVYVHDWWNPADEPAVDVKLCVSPRDPNDAGVGSYPLVNIIRKTSPDLMVLAGEAIAEAGEADALAGNYERFDESLVEYVIPVDTEKWHYFAYIGSATFGTMTTLPSADKDEFERLCLRIFPAQLWLVIAVNYV